MIKTLKITSILIAIVALGFAVFLVVFGLRGDRKIAEFINAPGAIEKFKKLAKVDTEQQDQTSPLVKQAKAFALRINPPPPPPPPKPAKPPAPKPVAKKKAPPPPKPKAPVRAKFDLIATCRYEQLPQRSLALLDIPPKGLKWYRQGEEVGHLTIQQIKDGSIVCSDGQELFVPPPKKTKSLLKTDLQAPAQPQPTTTVPLEPKATIVTTPPPPDELQPTDISLAESQPNAQNRPRVRRLPARKPQEPSTSVEPTPEQRKESLADNISAIKEIMSKSDSSTMDEQKQEELKIWEQLLKTLEKERDGIETAQ